MALGVADDPDPASDAGRPAQLSHPRCAEVGRFRDLLLRHSRPAQLPDSVQPHIGDRLELEVQLGVEVADGAHDGQRVAECSQPSGFLMKCGLEFGGDDARPGPGAPTTRRHTDTTLCVEVYGKEGAPNAVGRPRAFARGQRVGVMVDEVVGRGGRQQVPGRGAASSPRPRRRTRRPSRRTLFACRVFGATGVPGDVGDRPGDRGRGPVRTAK